MKRAAALAEVSFELPRATEQDLEAFRGRLAAGGATAQEAVLVDFLEDDLREAEGALGCVGDYLAGIEAALRDPRAGRRDVLALAAAGAPLAQQLEELEATLGNLRRRLAQVAIRLPA